MASPDATAEDMVIQELADDKAGEAFPVLLVTGDDEVVQEKASEAPAYFVNGKLFTEPINTLNPSDIKSMAVVKNDPEYPQGKIMIELKDAEHVYIATEETATYQDGMSALIDFLIQNLQYPESLKSPVRVIVQFTVTKDGGIEDCKIIRSGGAEADEEAIRVVKLTSGKWIPAVAGNGERVSSRFVLPINFKPSAE